MPKSVKTKKQMKKRNVFIKRYYTSLREMGAQIQIDIQKSKIKPWMHSNFAQLLNYRHARKSLHQFVNGLRNNIGIETDVTARRNTKHVTVTPLASPASMPWSLSHHLQLKWAARPTYPFSKAGRNIIWQSWWSHNRCHHRHPRQAQVTGHHIEL